LQSHPLAARHPNIIATHVLYREREPFLVEERLHQVLHDGWRAGGTVEAANLLHDIALALAYVHEVRGWVHGDIKPDNIGRKDGAYILLDFGICRPAAAFTREATATGSLRTRAPELFASHVYDDAPQKADVWALGATVYRAVTGRFLFIDESEAVPKITDPTGRSAFERLILHRIESEWGRRVVFDDVPEPLAGVLRRVLVGSPSERPTAKELVRLCGQKLAAFLRSSAWVGPAPEEEVRQILRHLKDERALALMPTTTKQNLAHLGLTQLPAVRASGGWAGRGRLERGTRGWPPG
jgi:serine/threonine protein kinase